MSKNKDMLSDHNNIIINGVNFDEDKKTRALDDIEDGTFSGAQAEESTSRGGGREAVAAGEVTSKARTTNHVLKATTTSRRRKSNPRRSPLA
ncbi:hypothetical protein BVRB_8g193300 [Beta vulgaris subsp. vulgaris]|nr:hypothetical protein BVRB_8g193300 [Beta vulgaris subsp. vulgaris]